MRSARAGLYTVGWVNFHPACPDSSLQQQPINYERNTKRAKGTASLKLYDAVVTLLTTPQLFVCGHLHVAHLYILHFTPRSDVHWASDWRNIRRRLGGVSWHIWQSAADFHRVQQSTAVGLNGTWTKHSAEEEKASYLQVTESWSAFMTLSISRKSQLFTFIINQRNMWHVSISLPQSTEWSFHCHMNKIILRFTTNG